VKTTPPVVPAEEPRGLFAGWNRFWFAPQDAFGLHLVRVLTGLVLLAWLLPLSGHVQALFGLQGWFDRQAYLEAARLGATEVPKPIGWSLLYLAGANDTALMAMYWGAIAILVLFTLGVATRLTAVGAWLVVVSFTATPLFDEEVDPLLHLLTLYLALGYLLLGLYNGKLTWMERIFGPKSAMLFGRLLGRKNDASPPSVAANVAVRLIQVHFAVMIVTSGLTKLQVGEWWAGVPHWFLLYPPLETTTARAREHLRDVEWFLSQLNVMAYATLAWQIFFPTFAWRGGWYRLLLLGGAVAGWIGLATLYKLPLFGPAFAIGCLAFISGREWGILGRALQRFSPLKRLAAMLPAVPESSALPGPHAGTLQAARER
jgi:hypothetical protein